MGALLSCFDDDFFSIPDAVPEQVACGAVTDESSCTSDSKRADAASNVSAPQTMQPASPPHGYCDCSAGAIIRSIDTGETWFLTHTCSLARRDAVPGSQGKCGCLGVAWTGASFIKWAIATGSVPKQPLGIRGYDIGTFCTRGIVEPRVLTCDEVLPVTDITVTAVVPTACHPTAPLWLHDHSATLYAERVHGRETGVVLYNKTTQQYYTFWVSTDAAAVKKNA